MEMPQLVLVSVQTENPSETMLCPFCHGDEAPSAGDHDARAG